VAKTSIGSTALHLSADSTEFEKGLSHAERLFKTYAARTKGEAASLQKEIKSSFGLGDIAKTAFGVAGGLGLAGGASGLGSALAGLVTDSIRLAASVEDTATDFRVMVGDAKVAAGLFADIRDFAGKTPLETSDLAFAAKTLLTIGVAADQIIPTLKVLGDIAGGQGEKLKTVAQIYGQIRTEGKLSGENLKQLGENGIVITAELAKVLGVGKAELAGLGSEGKIGFSDLQRAMIMATSEGGTFFRLMEERSKTFNGLLSTLKDNWQQLLAGVGQMVIDEFGLKDVLDKLAGSTDLAKGNLEGMRPIIRDLADLSKNIARDLYEGGWEFARAIASAKDAVGEIRADYKAVKTTASAPFSWKNWAFGPMAGLAWGNTPGARAVGGAVVGGGGPGGTASGMGPAEAAVMRMKAEADKIWGLRMGGGDAGAAAPLVGMAVEAGKAFGKAAGDALKVEADQLTRDQLGKLRGLREEFDPMAKVRRGLAELDVMRGRGGFDRGFAGNPFAKGFDGDLFAMARGKLLKDMLGGGFDMSKASGIAEAGSADAAGSVINALNAGQFKAEDKIIGQLKAQEAIQKQQRDLLKRLNDLIEKKKVPGVF
jgi:tape measure domain-containing protein